MTRNVTMTSELTREIQWILGSKTCLSEDAEYVNKAPFGVRACTRIWLTDTCPIAGPMECRIPANKSGKGDVSFAWNLYGPSSNVPAMIHCMCSISHYSATLKGEEERC